jgi:hypothetical protein
MSFLGDLGVNAPKINLTGALSSTWVYVLIIAIVGLLIVIGTIVFFFFLTYKKKVILFENISGQGYQPVLRTRARIVKLGIGGEELLKTFAGGHYISAYGRKMGRNTYWYAKGQDGYWYNIVLGDLDAKQGILDVEPIDRDVRMFHVALDRLSHQTYGKTNTLDKVLFYGSMFLFLIILVLGMWFIVGKIGEATAPLAQSQELNIKMQEAHTQTIQKLDSLIRAMGAMPEKFEGGSGLKPATIQ